VPAAGYRVDIERLQSEQSITFRWSAVPGANAYIFALYQQTSSGRRQIIRRSPENRTGFTLNDLTILDRGTFIWQVEAVSRSPNGAIERRGRPGENTFTIDIPLPGPVEVDEMGILYGS
jgi:hypothetical protein